MEEQAGIYRKELQILHEDGFSVEQLSDNFKLTENEIQEALDQEPLPDKYLILSLEGIPPSKNTYDNKHWAQQQKIHDKWKTAATVACNNSEPPAFNPPVCVGFIFSLPDRRIRDVENFVVHGILDGLEASDVVEDDNWKHIKEIRKRASLYDCQEPATRVWVEEIKNV